MAKFRCSSCGAPVTGFRCEYCEGPTVIPYYEMLREKQRLEQMRNVAVNTVIPVHLYRCDVKDIRERMKIESEIYL